MKQIKLNNGQIEILVNYHGAELRSIKKCDSDQEYLWDAKPEFWNRSSPVLFPFVGGVKNKVYRHEGKTYPMNQHGFARDMDFTLIKKSEHEVWFSLDSTEETYHVYPFHFHLEIGYRLEANGVVVMWKVKNPADKPMYFAIGAHPAFFCPLYQKDKQSEYYLCFSGKEGKGKNVITVTVFGEGGCVTTQKKDYMLEQGVLAIAENLFDADALVIEQAQVQEVSLLDSDKKEYLSVSFDSPLVGIWSPPKKNAPFVCIEPWYGRCDSEVFEGELKDREWENKLEANGEFYAEYVIHVF